MDPNYQKLAEVMTHYSVDLKQGERLLLEMFDVPEEMTLALIRAARKRKAEVFVSTYKARVMREFVIGASDKALAEYGRRELERMKKMDAYIALRGADNIFENAGIPAEAMKRYLAAMQPSFVQRVKKTKWVISRWPSPSMAQQACMSTEGFEDFFFRVTTLDYARMRTGMDALRNWMARTDKVHIQGPGTDLRFSIKAISQEVCGGLRNLPDGEVFTAPVKESVEGEITYNVPTVYQGTAFDNVHFKFKKGKIIEATSSNTKRMNQILDSDAGARYIGEFAIAFNPYILEPIRDILFDEKIAGSFHFTPGESYEQAGNGNRSQVHWDLVSIQRSEYGGGTISFDGKVIRKDGLFLPKDLQKLNPEYLVGKKK